MNTTNLITRAVKARKERMETADALGIRAARTIVLYRLAEQWARDCGTKPIREPGSEIIKFQDGEKCDLSNHEGQFRFFEKCATIAEINANNNREKIQKADDREFLLLKILD